METDTIASFREQIQLQISSLEQHIDRMEKDIVEKKRQIEALKAQILN
jgi:hypothetical protein